MATLPHPTDANGPHLEIRAVPTLLDLPPTFSAEAAILGTIANVGTPQVASFPAVERRAVFGGLLNTLWCATYHKGRFEQYVAAAYRHFEIFAGRAIGDAVGKAILFETQALLTAIRAFVEEVMYVAGRRASRTQDEADRRIPEELKATGTLAETAVLNRHRAWFEELTEYRNALVHRGTLDQFGYAPVGSDAPQADDPMCNVMLVPDLASIRRPKRPDAWTFSEKRRLEVLVRGTWNEMLTFVREVGMCWGCAVEAGELPPPESEYGSLVLVIPKGAVISRKAPAMP